MTRSSFAGNAVSLLIVFLLAFGLLIVRRVSTLTGVLQASSVAGSVGIKPILGASREKRPCAGT